MLSQRFHTQNTLESPLTRNYHGMNTLKESLAKLTKLIVFCIVTDLNQCPVDVNYKMMVRLVIEYASTVWAPYTLINISQLESIQRRAARFCCNDFSTYSSVTRMMYHQMIFHQISVHQEKDTSTNHRQWLIDSCKFSFFLQWLNSGTHFPQM